MRETGFISINDELALAVISRLVQLKPEAVRATAATQTLLVLKF